MIPLGALDERAKSRPSGFCFLSGLPLALETKSATSRRRQPASRKKIIISVPFGDLYNPRRDKANLLERIAGSGGQLKSGSPAHQMPHSNQSPDLNLDLDRFADQTSGLNLADK